MLWANKENISNKNKMTYNFKIRWRGAGLSWRPKNKTSTVVVRIQFSAQAEFVGSLLCSEEIYAGTYNFRLSP